MKFLVIGNPIKHSLSPKLHNYWIKYNKIDAVYEKKNLEEENIQILVDEIRNEKITGINVTIPFKKKIISFMDELSPTAKEVESVNTVYKKNGKIIGENTDAQGFEEALSSIKYDVSGKKILILGAGGVVTSLIYTLIKLKSGEITLSNRTKSKCFIIKDLFPAIKIINWGEITNFDMIINATSIGLKTSDKINLDYSKYKNKLFYDIIYNPVETYFLRKAKEEGNLVENGKLMFIHQAKLSFEMWHNKRPSVNEEVLKMLNND